jgi:hypothetical protein
MGSNCCKPKIIIENSLNDDKYIEEDFKYETFDDMIKENKMNLKSKAKGRRIFQEDIPNLKETIQKKISNETNNEILIEEMTEADFNSELSKHQKSESILNENNEELEKIKNDENELYIMPPLKFSNSKGTTEYYSGTFNKEGNFNGKGTLISKDGNIYKGTFKNGIFEGKGIFIQKNGNYYFGDWKNGKCEGEGKLIINDLIEYNGEFKNNKKNGNGIEKYKDGSFYNGDFINNEKDGFGKFNYSDGSFYNGQFKNSLFNGEGEFNWNDGRNYKGSFKNGIMEGKGEYTWIDGSVYNGTYINNCKNGFGVITWPNGKKFYGNFVNNEPHGDGAFICDNNEKYNIKYRFGKIISVRNVDDYKGETTIETSKVAETITNRN